MTESEQITSVARDKALLAPFGLTDEESHVAFEASRCAMSVLLNESLNADVDPARILLVSCAAVALLTRDLGIRGMR